METLETFYNGEYRVQQVESLSLEKIVWKIKKRAVRIFILWLKYSDNVKKIHLKTNTNYHTYLLLYKVKEILKFTWTWCKEPTRVLEGLLKVGDREH